MKKVSIITWHYFANVGSALQAYALQSTLSNMGYDVEIINYRRRELDNSWLTKKIKENFIYINKIFPNVLPERFRFGFLEFQNTYLKQSSLVHTIEDIGRVSADSGVIVCGSDQIWAPNMFDKAYFLTFANDETRKVAYAPSIGLENIPAEMIEIYKKLLKRFDYISVREDRGVELLRERCGIEDVRQVLDPTLLVDKEHWTELIKKEISPKGQYIFVYMLGEKMWQRDWIKRYAERNDKKIIWLSRHKKDKAYADIFYSIMGPLNFLKHIENADYVMTDSFHGMVFSLLFHKQYYLFERFDVQDELSQNSRIESLNRLLDTKNRVVKENVSFGEEKIDYTKIDKKIEIERKKSLEFLKCALE